MRTFSVREAATKLKLGRSTVTHLCKEGRIKAHQEHPRGHYVITSSALADFKASLKDRPMGKRGGYRRRKVKVPVPVEATVPNGEVSSALAVVTGVKAKLERQLDTLCKIETLLNEL